MLSIIVAHDRNRVIGVNNKLPWNLPQDLKRLKDLTMGKTIVMGRKTFESIGHALPGRRNIVVSKSGSLKQEHNENIEVIQDIELIIQRFSHTEEECFIFGGQQIFEKLLPFVQKIYVTFIDFCFDGDRYFPRFELSDWVLVEKELGVKNEHTPFDYFFLTYERRKNV
ncbi:MAG: dihydrofolate reductase [Bacillales bacterium]|jgi:dihydrofolate reductase|nr:dihydrofolate reductase [Bacillales bacterium]